MTLTTIERYAFGGSRAHFVAAFDVDGESITVRLTPVENESKVQDTIVRFPNARMLSDWTDTGETTQWPLDIIGFDCDQQAETWRFVLNCGTKEWIWESNWPTLEKPSAEQLT